MRLKISSSQITQAVNELGTCMHRAAGTLDAVRLSRDTLAFHLRNRLARPLDYEARQTYAMRIGDRVVDVRLRRGAGDLFVFHEVFTNECYRLPTTLRERIQTVVDLGSNVGLTALYWLDRLPHVRLICVEPAPDNAGVLRENLAAFGDRARVIEAAVGAATGTVTFSNDGASWERRVVDDPARGRTVRSVSVDDLFTQSGFDRIDLLKVDIEGGEAALFDRVHPWMERVGAMIVELHHPVTIDQFSETVTAAGFDVLQPTDDSEHEMLLAMKRGA